MKKFSRNFIMGMLIIIGSVFLPACSDAMDMGSGSPLLEGTETTKQYLLQISGTAMNETFSGAQALLTLAPSGLDEMDNPYLLIVEGFPKQNSRNTFFWNSGYSEMSAISNEITCDVKRTFGKGTHMFFMFLSPALLRLPTVGQDPENVALPTEVGASAGRLKLRIHANSVSGTVWMKGYDPIEKAFVLYSARIYGTKSYHLKPRQDKKRGTTGKE